jgi:WXXGXW repeat (2 copies)
MNVNWKKWTGSLLLAGSLMAAAPAFGQIEIGIHIGAPPPIRVLHVRPVQPGPDYMWINGYWYPVNARYVWHAGYWTRPPYAGAHWVAWHHDGERFYGGYWDGPHGRFEHDHEWDKHQDRDENHWRDHDDHDHDHHSRN